MTEDELMAIEARTKAASTGPWTVEAGDYSGQDWLIAFLGVSLDGTSYAVTTDRVHASELVGDACSDALFIACAREDVPALLAEVWWLRAELDAANERAEKWQRRCEAERERREYDSTDAYNRRISDALKRMREDEQRRGTR